jgi:integrase
MRSPPGAASTCLAGPGRAACEIQKSAAQPTANSAERNLAPHSPDDASRAHHRGSGNLFGQRLKQAGKNRQSRAPTLRPMSDNAILAAMRRMGVGKDEMSGHGFRAVARTILDEVLGVRPDYIEHQLAHAVRDPNGRAYNRTAHLPERRKMMQQWADYLDKLKAGRDVIALHGHMV